MKQIVAEFISDAQEGPGPRGDRLFHTGWEDVVFRLDDVPAVRPAAASPESAIPFEGEDPFAPLPGAEIK
jgi:hypothetical protein